MPGRSKSFQKVAEHLLEQHCVFLLLFPKWNRICRKNSEALDKTALRNAVRKLLIQYRSELSWSVVHSLGFISYLSNTDFIYLLLLLVFVVVVVVSLLFAFCLVWFGFCSL